MRKGHVVVNTIVLAVAAFFTFLGVSFFLMPILGAPDLIEGGGTPDKAALGVIFLLAAAPMFYYVFGKSARALPPARKPPRPGRAAPEDAGPAAPQPPAPVPERAPEGDGAPPADAPPTDGPPGHGPKTPP